MKSDDANKIGKHIFEVYGLGKAPFRFFKYEIRTFQAAPDAPVQVGGSCDFCSQGIKQWCWVVDANGKKFKVGPECIKKTDDANLIKQFKDNPDVRKAKRDQRHKREKAKIEECKKLIEDNKEKFKTMDHSKKGSYPFWDDKTFLDYVTWMMEHAGTAGKIRLLKEIKNIL